MKYRTRIYYTEEQKALMWDHWQRGDSLATIAQATFLHSTHPSGEWRNTTTPAQAF